VNPLQTSNPFQTSNKDKTALVEGQRIDRMTGLVQPWFTHAALDEIEEWALYDKVVLEWGGGHSTLWWGTRCRQVFTVETSREWCEWISAQAGARGIGNISILHRPPEIPRETYVQIPEGCAPHIVVIDGWIGRLACLRKALTLPRPVTVIFDNWQQDASFISPEAETLMKPFLGTSYPQIHPAHEKHPWQTAIWHLPVG
jgi:hypothetical protein